MNKNAPYIILVAVMASLLEIIDTSIVNVALPTMMGNLGATLEDISMVITGYAIANAIVLPFSSWLSERVGRRKYYLSCILAFTAASVACGLAPNLFTLTLFRIVQGFMGGALLPTSQALIYEQFPKEKAGIAGAIFGMSVMIGPTLGPVMGGYLTDQLGWRSIFNINLPLGLITFFLGSLYIVDRPKLEGEAAQNQKLDVFGLVLLILSVGCLQFVLERGEADDWFASKTIIFNSIIFIVSLPTFIWWELKIPNPIINIRLFKNGIVTNGVGLMMGLGFFLYSVILLIPVFLTRSFHYSATQTGMFFIPGSILTAMMMPFIGNAMNKGVHPKILIFIGLISVEICLYMMTHFSSLTNSQEVLAMLFMRGFALAFLFVPINSSILSEFKGAALAQVSGLLNLFRQIGGSIGVAFVATMLTKNSAQNYLDLRSHVSLLNTQTQQLFQQLDQSLDHKLGTLTGMDALNHGAIQTIKHKVDEQVFMMSTNQLVYYLIIIFAFTFIPLFLLKINRNRKVKVVDAH
ncbi:MAG: DHA2 family efflux MFS transporter permease subunit [Bacteriovoracaceae bacterium]|nr:DHA2 family efflux MFS transporter permease subunit [Bacteriovoracaceae bacterium]